MAENANTVWADGPGSAPYMPEKSKIRAWGTWLESFLTAIGANSGSVYTTRALLYADLAHVANEMAWVVQDTTAAYNGIYLKSGASGAGAWAKVGDLPYSFITATDTGAGTANAIQATTSISVSESALIILNVFRANTGSPVTVSFNAGTVLTVKTNTGNDVSATGLVAGMRLLGVVSGSTFRLVSDQVSTAVVAAAEAAAAAALLSKNAAGTSETNAGNSATLAQKWANEAEDVVVAGGLYSAYHWAKKAAAVVTGGISAAIHAATAKTTLDDLDELGFADSAGSWALKKMTWLTAKLQTLVFPYASLASAATTCDIGAATTKNINITGTTGITAFPAAAAGTERWLKFAAVLTLTYNATSLILPGLANLTVAAGDKIRAVSLGGGNWELSQYEPALFNSNKLGRKVGATLVPAGLASYVYTGIPAGVAQFTVHLRNVVYNAVAQQFIRVGPAAGVVTTGYEGSTGINASGSATNIPLSTSILLDNGASNTTVNGDITFTRVPGTFDWEFSGQFTAQVGTPHSNFVQGGILLAAELDRFQVSSVAGTPTMSGTAIWADWEFPV